jgi:hypothetical protein
VGEDARFAVTGGVLAAAGGFLVTIGALLPWERLVIPPCGPTPGCFGPHGGPAIFLYYGTQIANGIVAMIAGAVMAMVGLFMTAYPAARRPCTIVLAAAVVVAAAAAGGWWLKIPGAVIAVGAIESCGVLLGLAAVPLCLPGPVRRRASLLAATILLCVIGVALIRSWSTPDGVSF